MCVCVCVCVCVSVCVCVCVCEDSSHGDGGWGWGVCVTVYDYVILWASNIVILNVVNQKRKKENLPATPCKASQAVNRTLRHSREEHAQH